MADNNVLFLIYFFSNTVNDSCQTNYLNICWTDVRQVFRVGTNTAVHDKSEISFSIPNGTLAINFCFMHKT